MKRIFYAVLLYFISLTLYAQNLQRSTLGNSGSSIEISGSEDSYYISQSVGQSSVIGILANENHTIRQGFQQPPIRVVIVTDSNNDLEAIVFPNPVDTFITIQFDKQLKTSIDVVVYDISGKMVLQRSQGPTGSFNLDLSFLSAGTYLLNLSSENKRFLARLIKK